ncbi:MAG: 3-oxo-tetronate kinase [Candidatus Velthaea sp.]
MNGVLLGAVADDFTGATDLADTLVAAGMRTVQTIGVPSDGVDADADAVVVALKTRSIDPAEAVAQSLSALEYLERLGTEQIVFKYCSTFDSTPRGNIGPVGDALAERLQQAATVFCPAYPANARTIYAGYLFVGGVPLSESGMRDHPLTPMHDANLVRVLAAQSRRRVALVGLHHVRGGAPAICAALAGEAAAGPVHLIVDATEDDDLLALGEALEGARLVTGGAGIAPGLAHNFRRHGRLRPAADAVTAPVSGGRAAVLSGSASTATREQIAELRAAHPVFDITTAHLNDCEGAVEGILAWAEARPAGTPIVISATAEPDEVRRNQERYGAGEAGRRVEKILARAAAGLTERGVRRFVVAGGETAGAVVGELGVRRLRIGPRIATGVPWTVADTRVPLGLALKSGNFGGRDFFVRALAMTA